jgi:hypothetical protein
VALTAIATDTDLLAFDKIYVGIVIIMDAHFLLLGRDVTVGWDG